MTLGRSLIYNEKATAPEMEAWVTPTLIIYSYEVLASRITNRRLLPEMTK